MLCLILLIILLSRVGRCYWGGYGYGYTPYYRGYAYPPPPPYAYGTYTPYDPAWRARYYWDGYGYRRCW